MGTYGSPTMGRKGKKAKADENGQYDPNQVLWAALKQACNGKRRRSGDAADNGTAEGGAIVKGLDLYGLLEGDEDSWAAALAKAGSRKRARKQVEDGAGSSSPAEAAGEAAVNVAGDAATRASQRLGSGVVPRCLDSDLADIDS